MSIPAPPKSQAEYSESRVSYVNSVGWETRGECRSAGGQERAVRVQESTGLHGLPSVRVQESTGTLSPRSSCTLDRRPAPAPAGGQYHTCDRRTRKKVTIREEGDESVV